MSHPPLLPSADIPVSNVADWPLLLREPCGRPWDNELLDYRVHWPVGRQPDADLVVCAATRSLATQVSDTAWHGDGSLAAATLTFRASVAPGEELLIELARGPGPQVAPDLSWRQDEDGAACQAANSRLRVRVPASGRYPVDAVPGPVMALEASGEWVGCGVMTAAAAATVKTQLTELGALFARWTVTYADERRCLAAVECTLFAGEDFVRIRDTSSLDADLAFHFDCFPGLSPDRLLTLGGGERFRAEIREICFARPEQLITVDFNSGHQQMSHSWFGAYSEYGDDLIGVVELNGADWTRVSANRIHLMAAPPQGLAIVSPLTGGRKEWALVCGSCQEHLAQADCNEPIRLCRIHQRYSDLPLRKVRNWVLEWEPDLAPRPFLQCAADGMAAARRRVADAPDLSRAYRAWGRELDKGGTPTGSRASALAAAWVALGDEHFLSEAAESLAREVRETLETIWTEGGLMRLIIFHGRSMKLWLQAYDMIAAAGVLSAQTDRDLRRDLAFLAYCLADPDFFPGWRNLSDLDDPDSFFLGLGERIGDAMCPPNFQTEYYTTYGLMACCFPGHPQAAAWRAEATAMLERQLDVHFYDSGAYCESPNYHAHVFVMLNQLALALRRSGGPDFYQHPRLKAQFDYFCQMQTPPVKMNEAARAFQKPWQMLDPDRERYAMLPGNGNTGQDCSDKPLPVELAVGAAVYNDTDPGLSARCMTTWWRGGRRIANQYDDLTFLLCANPSLETCESLELGSGLLTGAYATFRASAESADEVFVLTKNGTATHHNDFDEGGFTIWAYGAPVASDFGYHARHQGRNCGVGDTWKHNCVEFDGKTSGYLGIEKTTPPEHWVRGELADLLVSHIPITNFRDLDNMDYMDRIPCTPIEYRRYTLFVRPGYLLVFDSILECEYTHRWWLHAQADSVSVDGPRVRFGGPFGVDLVAHFIRPEEPIIEAGQWGPMKHISARQTHAADWRVFVAPIKPGQDFEVSYANGGRIVQVETDDFHDTIFLAHYPFHCMSDNVEFQGRAGIVRNAAGACEPQLELLSGDILERL